MSNAAKAEPKPIVRMQRKKKAKTPVKTKAGLPDAKATVCVKPNGSLPSIIADIQELQRHRNRCQKTRISLSNNLESTVAVVAGYHIGLDPGERKKAFAQAKKIIAMVREDHTIDAMGIGPLIFSTDGAISSYEAKEKAIEKQMVRLAKQLPVAAWVEKPEQRGFGLLGLAIVVGECGDLSNYPNPGKLWKRLGSAPITKNGKTMMPSTWRSHKGLSAEDWEEAGYCPRRASVRYKIQEPLFKLNHTKDSATGQITWVGPYRAHYEKKRKEAQEKHPEWSPDCKPCNGTGRDKHGDVCEKCKGKGKLTAHLHNHSLLLMAKRLIRELWVEWTGNDHGYVWRSEL